MNRADFIAMLLAAPVYPAVAAQTLDIPVVMRGGRFFAVPRTADGRAFRCWLDTDGSGFIFAEAVRAFGLRVDGKSASLPAFAPNASIPEPGRNGGTLPVFERSAADRADPILQDFEAQLGATWFAGRIWRMNFKSQSVAMLHSPLAERDATASVELTDSVYPHIVVRVDGETLQASFDIAASLATGKTPSDVRATSFVTAATFDKWSGAHPEWTARTYPGGVRAIFVPDVSVGETTFTNVEFSTRPNDDVFEGQDLQLKLGANAFADSVVTIDYTTARLAIAGGATRA